MAAFLSAAPVTRAAQFGDFTYVTNVSVVTITGYTGAGGSVVIPDAIDSLPVTCIGAGAFQVHAGLTGITIPLTVTNIGAVAFESCASLGSVAIPASVRNIGQSAFGACYSMTSITVAAGNEFYSGADGVLFNKNLTSLIQYPSGKTGAYTVPDSVTAIEEAAFTGACELTRLTIPDGVISIGAWAFASCVNLTSVTIGSGVTDIRDRTFANCGSLEYVTLPNGITNLGDLAFYDCSMLKSIAVPDGVTRIGSQAFDSCLWLTNVTIGSGVTAIGYSAFRSCTRLKAIAIPDGVTSIGDEAFSGCVWLLRVVIPDSVTSLGRMAFSYCGRLVSVTIGSGVSSLGEWTFDNCPALQRVFFAGDPPTADASGLDGTSATVYYLPLATGWGSTFAGRPAVLWNPAFATAAANAEAFSSTITGTTNIPIAVQTCTNLDHGAWTTLHTTNVTGGSVAFRDARQPQAAVRFYRIAAP